MGFMDGILDVLGGPMAVEQIDKNGFDWRQKRSMEQFARDRTRELAAQQNEDRSLKQAEDVMAGAENPESVNLDPLLGAMDPAKRKLQIDMLLGRAKERKASIEGMKAQTQALVQSNRDAAAMEREKYKGEMRQQLLAQKAALDADRTMSPRDREIAKMRIDAQLEMFGRAEAGRNARFAAGLGKPQRVTSTDENGNVVYRWISPGESAPAAPTATQRETSGMAGNIEDVMGMMEDLAPKVSYGPIEGRISVLKQSQYPSGNEAEFDAAVRQLVDLAYIKSGKQINKQELELQLKGMVDRTKGDLPGQVERAGRYVEKILQPYQRSGLIPRSSGGGGETRTYGGVTYRLRPGADPKKKSSWEPVR